MTDPRNQPQYQVRFGFGLRQALALSLGADVLIWADALPALALTAPHPGAEVRIGVALLPALPALPAPAAILTAGTGAAHSVAHWVLARQTSHATRVTVAVIAVGDHEGGFAVEDLLAAGAIISALADVGIDYMSPEAASAAAAFTGLALAHDHLLSASVAGQQHALSAGSASLASAIVSNAQASFEIVRE
ncbi:MAG: hypothetical protein ACOH1K_00100 [Rhodoglobus sp.]